MTTNPSSPENESFASHLDELAKFLRDLGLSRWNEALVTERLTISPYESKRLGSDIVWTPQEYAVRFAELMKRGHSWINVNGVGILRETLIIDVDWPQGEPAEAGVTSVNLSGPENWIKERSWKLDGVLELADGAA